MSDAAPEQNTQAQANRLKTILIADDSIPYLNLMGERLTQAGYRVVKATDGEEALKKARRLAPDLIILDIMMPKIDGTEVRSTLGESDPTAKTPIIFLTSLISKEDEIDPRGRSADVIVAKSSDAAELLTAIKKLIG